MRLSLSLFLASLFFVGCTSHQGVSPSQNNSLNTVSPNTASMSKGGAMQNSLDSWLKEDWIPNTSAHLPATSSSAPEGHQSATGATDTAVVTDEKPFTLQSYADKWKVYHENKEKMNEGKPKEASHIDAVNALPVIGK